jgi:hypothetical protein
LVAGVVVIVGVFLACTWVMVAQPTVGQISLTTVVVVVVIVGLSIGIITHYVGLLAEIVSFIDGRTRKPSAVMDPDRLVSAEAAQEPTVTEELRPADIEELLIELEEAEAEKGSGEGES